MKKLFALLTSIVAFSSPVLADEDKITKGFKSMDSMGCMLLRECTDNVKRITSIQDIKDRYPYSDYSSVANEFNDIISACLLYTSPSPRDS